MTLFRKDNMDYLSLHALSGATLAQTCQITEEEPNVSSDNQSVIALAGVFFIGNYKNRLENMPCISL